MRNVFLVMFAVFLSSCGSEEVTLQSLSGKDGINGLNGADGQDGQDGANGINGTNGTNGKDGKDGQDGEPARKPGLNCNVHNLASWSSSTSLPEVLASNAPVGSFVLPRLNIPDSPSANGFPGMPANLQAIVGLEGYALDCYGHIYISTSGLHSFTLLSDDGSQLSIEDAIIVANQGLHAPQSVTVNKVYLNRGWNRINVVYYQGPHTQVALELRMTGPNSASAVVPANLFTHY